MIAGLRGYAVTSEDDDSDVTPEAAISDVSKEVDALKEAFTGATEQIQNLTGSLQSATIAAATIKIPENFQVNVDELNNRLASASVSVSQVQDVYNSIEKSLDGQPEAHRDVVSASDKLVVQLEEMNSLVKQLNEKYSAIAKAMGK
jgi:chromosome segregation ATPase